MVSRKRRRMAPGRESAPASDGWIWLYGRHAVLAALANPDRTCGRLLVTRECADLVADPGAAPGAAWAPEPVAKRDLDARFGGAAHQGIAAAFAPGPEPDLNRVCAGDGAALVVVLDRVTDPGNVGAVIRSAAAFGARAVVTTRRHAPEPAGALAKAASGTLERVPYLRVANLARALDDLAALGYWCLALDRAAGQDLAAVPDYRRVALILGAEGSGLRRLTAEHADLTVRIPMAPGVESLNVSNAAAVALHHLAGGLGLLA